MRNCWLCLAFALSLTAPAAAPTAAQPGVQGPERRSYPSTDGIRRALVVDLPPRGDGESESVVTIQTAKGRTLARRDYSSEDGSHGHRVVRARWTPDGRFFVFSLASSGGHSPWHSPTHFFSRRRGKFYGLDDFIQGKAVMSPAFQVRAPAIVCVQNRDGKTVRVDLHRLEKRLTPVSVRSEYDNY